MASDATTPVAQAPVAAAAPVRYVRHEVSTAAGQQSLAAYSQAVAAMQARPVENPTSWEYQAAMHGTYAQRLKQLWKGCKHLSWYFLPWHRMFVYYFEQIARAAVVEAGGPPDWALPYWNYGLGGPNASIPQPFREPTVGNPLYVNERAPRINAGKPLPEGAIDPRLALARPSYIGAIEFGGPEGPATPQFWEEPGALEGTPHNIVHDEIGGWMSDPQTAAKDPIFWLHHCQIDRLWARWNSLGHANPAVREWEQQSFEFFDVDGKLVSKRCMQVLDTAADLGYEYDQLTQ
jgi:tyrosinase